MIRAWNADGARLGGWSDIYPRDGAFFHNFSHLPLFNPKYRSIGSSGTGRNKITASDYQGGPGYWWRVWARQLVVPPGYGELSGGDFEIERRNLSGCALSIGYSAWASTAGTILRNGHTNFDNGPGRQLQFQANIGVRSGNGSYNNDFCYQFRIRLKHGLNADPAHAGEWFYIPQNTAQVIRMRRDTIAIVDAE